jgi:cellobiose-specific phosphotransferase system component IIA
MRLGRTFLIVAAIAVAAGCGHEDVNTTLEKVARARELAADLTVQFTMASDAANRSVMAETDDASVEFAKESRESTAAVQRDVVRLGETLHTLGYAPEEKLLTEFANNFAEYRKLDDSILGLAVENTNLKAQRLAFGPALDAANAFRDALQAVTPANAGDARHVEALIATALLTVREIQVLQAPHIANADEAVMTRMEQQMSTSQAGARKALDELRQLSAPSSRSKVDAAGAALNRFLELNTQLIALSRRNTNVRSLMLSLDEKRKLTVACQDSLRALQVALAKRGYSGIREH